MRQKLDLETCLVRADHRQSRYLKVRAPPKQALPQAWKAGRHITGIIVPTLVPRTSRTIQFSRLRFHVSVLEPFVKEPIFQPKFIRPRHYKRTE